MSRTLILVLALLSALLPTVALAQSSDSTSGGFVLRIDGDYWLRPGEVADNVVVINGHARIDGVVHSSLVVFSGTATVTGTVDGDIRMVRSDLDLRGSAVVNDVSMFRGNLVRDPAATVSGDLNQSDRYFLWNGWWVVFGIVVLVGVTVFVVAAGLLFAAIGSRQLAVAVASMSAEPGKTIAAGIVMIAGLPLVALAALVTIVGIPIALGLLLLALPLMSLLGHLVAGTWVGTLLLRRHPAPAHPYAEAALGLLLLQVAMFVPGVGILAAILGTVWGTGALTLMAWRGVRRTIKPAGELPANPAVGGGLPHPA